VIRFAGGFALGFQVQILSPRHYSKRKPFGEHIEGLYPCRDESYVVEAAVQKGGFEDLTLGSVIEGKPLPSAAGPS
jgi:hypothetical protein